MALKRHTKFWFACWMIGGFFCAYGTGAFLNYHDNPAFYSFAFQYSNTSHQTPWERLQEKILFCRNERAMRNVPLARDGDALDIKESCDSERIAAVSKAGILLNSAQLNVLQAAKIYAEQKRYYWLAGFFFIMGILPWLATRITHHGRRVHKPFQTAWRFLRSLARKMS